MSLQLQTPISTARTILNDPDGVRYTDADLLQYANDALDQMMLLAPRLFYSDGDLECIPHQCLQTVSCADAHALVAIKRIKNGRAVLRTEKDVLDAFDPNWQSANESAAVNWMPSLDDPLRFFIYPPAPINQTLEVSYIRIPPEFSATDDTLVSSVYADAVADYIVYRAESRDDDHINTNRVQAFLQSFVGKIKGA